MLRTPDLTEPDLFGAAEIFRQRVLPVRIDGMRMIITCKKHIRSRISYAVSRQAAELLAQTDARLGGHTIADERRERGHVLGAPAVVDDKIGVFP